MPVRKTAEALEETEFIPMRFGTGRAAEVTKWIEVNKPISYVILDDEDWDWSKYNLDKNWIRSPYCEDYGGINKNHVKRAIKILNQEA